MADSKKPRGVIDTTPVHKVENTELSPQIGSYVHQRYVKAATSDNTRRAYQSAIRHFGQWGGALPTTQSTVMNYLLAHAQTLSTRTLALRLTALKNWHKLQGFNDPVTDEVKILLKGIERKEGRPKEKAATFTLKDLTRMVQCIDKESDLKALRDKALILIGFWGAFRRSELVGITAENIKVVEEGVVITVPRSKTDQEGAGLKKPLQTLNNLLCPVTALNTWMYESGIEQGEVFRGINRWELLKDNGLTATSVNLILKDRARKAGLEEAPNLSAHSLRRSLATTVYKAGGSFSSIKRQGNWTNDATVWGYIEEAKLFEDNVMNMFTGDVLPSK